MLRAQINPHFLFNTLNNIKSLIKSIPSKAIYSVEKLTGIMHYMLYESSFETVSLENEISHINNYLDLEKIRYSDPDYISFRISGDCSKIQVPPLIFMPFVENAFKHGDKLKPAPGIIIKIEAIEKNIRFEIKNFIKESWELKNKNSGFGLANIRRRLDLLFDKKYELSIKTENKTFAVKLNLNLS
jgi:LytS/YehU family sensor histidine kinase